MIYIYHDLPDFQDFDFDLRIAALRHHYTYCHAPSAICDRCSYGMAGLESRSVWRVVPWLHGVQAVYQRVGQALHQDPYHINKNSLLLALHHRSETTNHPSISTRLNYKTENAAKGRVPFLDV